MPTYEFRCPEGHEFEQFYRSISASPRDVACPVCGKLAERLMSAGGGLVFKGSGFYITDYGKDGKKPQTPSPAEGKSTEPAKGDTTGKTESTRGDTSAKTESKSGDSKTGSEAKAPAAEKPRPAKKKDSE
jgi:putative FmdB family regulatory protein